MRIGNCRARGGSTVSVQGCKLSPWRDFDAAWMTRGRRRAHRISVDPGAINPWQGPGHAHFSSHPPPQPGLPIGTWIFSPDFTNVDTASFDTQSKVCRGALWVDSCWCCKIEKCDYLRMLIVCRKSLSHTFKAAQRRNSKWFDVINSNKVENSTALQFDSYSWYMFNDILSPPSYIPQV